MEIQIRDFRLEDIPNRVKWINDSNINKYLHYDVPITIEGTEKWFEAKDNSIRYDGIIEANGVPVGIIGLLDIDQKKLCGEFYITIGESEYFGKNLGYLASLKMFEYGFNILELNNIYLTTEINNIKMQKICKKIGMYRLGPIMNFYYKNKQYTNAYYYSIDRSNFNKGVKFPETPLSKIEFLESFNSNNIYIMRDDLISFSFGGNKARKAKYFFNDIKDSVHDVIVTYGSRQSNHCRVIANCCKANNLKCIIISPYSEDKMNINRSLVESFNANIIECHINDVASTIDAVLADLTKQGHQPYFIEGGGHGDLGTQAYLDAYNEIKLWEFQENIEFDYIFLASGTGSTQAGLVVGKILNKDFDRRIIGISIARSKEKGSKVIIESVREFIIRNFPEKIVDFNYQFVEFEDTYILRDYSLKNDQIEKQVKRIMESYGIALSTTYTGKAYTGMINYICRNNLTDKRILFINTGGIPLYFDSV